MGSNNEGDPPTIVLDPRSHSRTTKAHQYFQTGEGAFDKCVGCQAQLDGILQRIRPGVSPTHLLSCGHVLCENCVVKFRSKMQQQSLQLRVGFHSESMLKCPKCVREVHAMKLPGLNKIFDNICTDPNCKSSNQHTYFCKNCNQRYCMDCDPQRIKQSKEFAPTCLNHEPELVERPLPRTDYGEQMKCSRHNVKATHLCAGCGELCCKSCRDHYSDETLGTRAYHHMVPINEKAVQDFDLEDSMMMAKELQTNCYNLREKARRGILDNLRNTNYLKEIVCGEFHAMFNAAIGRLVQMCDEIDRATQEHNDRLYKAQQASESAIHRMEVGCNIDNRARDPLLAGQSDVKALLAAQAYNVFRPSHFEMYTAKTILDKMDERPLIGITTGNTLDIVQKISRWGGLTKMADSQNRREDRRLLCASQPFDYKKSWNNSFPEPKPKFIGEREITHDAYKSVKGTPNLPHLTWAINLTNAPPQAVPAEDQYATLPALPPLVEDSRIARRVDVPPYVEAIRKKIEADMRQEQNRGAIETNPIVIDHADPAPPPELTIGQHLDVFKQNEEKRRSKANLYKMTLCSLPPLNHDHSDICNVTGLKDHVWTRKQLEDFDFIYYHIRRDIRYVTSSDLFCAQIVSLFVFHNLPFPMLPIRQRVHRFSGRPNVFTYDVLDNRNLQAVYQRGECHMVSVSKLDMQPINTVRVPPFVVAAVSTNVKSDPRLYNGADPEAPVEIFPWSEVLFGEDPVNCPLPLPKLPLDLYDTPPFMLSILHPMESPHHQAFVSSQAAIPGIGKGIRTQKELVHLSDDEDVPSTSMGHPMQHMPSANRPHIDPRTLLSSGHGPVPNFNAQSPLNAMMNQLSSRRLPVQMPNMPSISNNSRMLPPSGHHTQDLNAQNLRSMLNHGRMQSAAPVPLISNHVKFSFSEKNGLTPIDPMLAQQQAHRQMYNARHAPMMDARGMRMPSTSNGLAMAQPGPSMMRPDQVFQQYVQAYQPAHRDARDVNPMQNYNIHEPSVPHQILPSQHHARTIAGANYSVHVPGPSSNLGSFSPKTNMIRKEPDPHIQKKAVIRIPEEQPSTSTSSAIINNLPSTSALSPAPSTAPKTHIYPQRPSMMGMPPSTLMHNLGQPGPSKAQPNILRRKSRQPTRTPSIDETPSSSSSADASEPLDKRSRADMEALQQAMLGSMNQSLPVDDGRIPAEGIPATALMELLNAASTPAGHNTPPPQQIQHQIMDPDEILKVDEPTVKAEPEEEYIPRSEFDTPPAHSKKRGRPSSALQNHDAPTLLKDTRTRKRTAQTAQLGDQPGPSRLRATLESSSSSSIADASDVNHNGSSRPLLQQDVGQNPPIRVKIRPAPPPIPKRKLVPETGTYVDPQLPHSSHVAPAASLEQDASDLNSLNGRDLDEDGKLINCFVCNDVDYNDSTTKGICSNCPRIYHQTCHVPNVTVPWDDLPDNWQCIMCEQSSSVHIDSSQPLTAAARRQCAKVLISCYKDPVQAAWFSKPVTDFDDYLLVIDQPMDFGTIGTHLSNPDDTLIVTSTDFIMQMNQVFKNCGKFNRKNSPVGLSGKFVWQVYKDSVRVYLPQHMRDVWMMVFNTYDYSELTRKKAGMPPVVKSRGARYAYEPVTVEGLPATDTSDATRRTRNTRNSSLRAAAEVKQEVPDPEDATSGANLPGPL